MSRFAQPELSDQDQGSAPARSVSVDWREAVDDAFDNLPTPLEALSADALEHSSMRKVQIEEIQNALGTQAGAALEEVTFIYARAVYFIDRFMATMEPAGPRVPLDESSRIICDLIDVFERDLKAFMAVSMARLKWVTTTPFTKPTRHCSPSLWGPASGSGASCSSSLGWLLCFTKSASSICPTGSAQAAVPARRARDPIAASVSHGAALAPGEGGRTSMGWRGSTPSWR